jgi:hypothetical protein
MTANIIPQRFPELLVDWEVDEHVLDKNGDVRPFSEIVDQLSSLKWATQVMLEYHMREQLKRPRARGYPPRIFISYRRETPEHCAWCIRLAKEIEKFGYDVYLDLIAIGQNPSPPEVAKFISRLADSDIALVVITESYLKEEDQDDNMREWLYQEWSRVQALQGWGLLEVILAVRSSSGPTPFINFDALETKIIDLRASPNDFTEILNFLGTYRGLRYSRDDQARLANMAASAIASAQSDNTINARAQLDEIAEFSHTEEYQLAKTFVLAAERNCDDAVSAALSLIKTEPSLPIAAEAARKLWLLDADLEAFPTLAELAEIPSLWRLQAHYLMADILRRNRMPHAAINHFGWCLWVGGDSQLDFSRGPHAEADLELNIRARLATLWFLVGSLEEYHKYSANLPESEFSPLWDDLEIVCEAYDVQRDPMVRFDTGLLCMFCRGVYFRNGRICVFCGACYGRVSFDQVANDCQMCKSSGTMVSHDKLTFCPACRIVFVGETPTRVIMRLPRGPGGLFSVLPYRRKIEGYGTIPVNKLGVLKRPDL